MTSLCVLSAVVGVRLISRPDMMIEFLWVTDAMNIIVPADRIYQVIQNPCSCQHIFEQVYIGLISEPCAASVS